MEDGVRRSNSRSKKVRLLAEQRERNQFTSMADLMQKVSPIKLARMSPKSNTNLIQ